MKQRKNNIKILGIIPVIIVTFVLRIMYSSYMSNLQEQFDQINRDIKEGTTIVLTPDADTALLSKIIYENGYCDTMPDAEFIANTLVERQKEERLSSLYSLQKRKYGQVSAHVADSLSVLKKTLNDSREKIGLKTDSVYESFKNDSLFEVIRTNCLGSDSIIVVVERENTKERCKNIPVRLQLHHRIDTIINPLTLEYGTTNENGMVVFRNLCADSSFSVLPIKMDYEYGRTQGVVGGEWNNNEFTFVEKEHMIPLFTNNTLRQIKNEGTIIVREPDEVFKELVKSRKWFYILWWLLALAIISSPVFHFFKRKLFPKRIALFPPRELSFSSGIIIACCMFLSGVSILMMFSMRDPVNDEIQGWIMTEGVMGGVGVAILLQCWDIVKLYNRKLFPFRRHQGLEKIHMRGLGWLVIALVLTTMLFIPGLGKSVGGMTVNIDLGAFEFQPSEIAKFLVVLFSAIFFTENIDWIIHYSNEFETNIKGKITTMLGMIMGLMILLGIYSQLGDMGPALVLGITFVLLYSFCKSGQELREGEGTQRIKFLKSDFMILIYGVVSYVLFLLAFRRFFEELFGAKWGGDCSVFIVAWRVGACWAVPDKEIYKDQTSSFRARATVPRNSCYYESRHFCLCSWQYCWKR